MKELLPFKVVGLDLSPTIGFAVGCAGEVPRWGAVVLPKTSGYGAVCAAFEDWFDQFLETEKPDEVAYEAPLAPNNQGDREAAVYNFGLMFAAHGCCWRAGLIPLSHSLDTVRGAVIGRTQLTQKEKAVRPRPTVKTQIVSPWVKSMGWDISNPDARDAAVVWAYRTGIRHINFRKKRAA